ncbi:RNA degradosome polyphosphate kinase [Heliorestis convoluta]|uniref:ATP-polyphosphate phosphotransferase n=1 Tax=Heliorestis convoluta TaxID=356322 RepID=A0A5Q2N093_9FIRM|nr:RNA degradosome polyphosphate kinase [Heliorestis convoluta]
MYSGRLQSIEVEEKKKIELCEETESFLSPDYYINRELSWLEFNHRVLEEALNHNNPLLERFKFLAIVSSNLDEFFMVRVAGVQDQVEAGFRKKDAAGLTPLEQLQLISERVHRLVGEQYEELTEQLLPQLHKEGIHILSYDQLDATQQAFIEEYFEHIVYPVLTPMAVDQSRPFPLLANKSLNVAVLLEPHQPLICKRLLFGVVQVPLFCLDLSPFQ